MENALISQRNVNNVGNVLVPYQLEIQIPYTCVGKEYFMYALTSFQ